MKFLSSLYDIITKVSFPVQCMKGLLSHYVCVNVESYFLKLCGCIKYLGGTGAWQ